VVYLYLDRLQSWLSGGRHVRAEFAEESELVTMPEAAE
jgi:hypothetical protein